MSDLILLLEDFRGKNDWIIIDIIDLKGRQQEDQLEMEER